MTWNPVTGCSQVSPGCLNCYAERMAKRLQAMGQPNYRDGFAVRTHDHMLQAVKFLSAEPLLGPLPDLDLDGIDWVIVGGESGPRSRRIQHEWVCSIRDACVDRAVPFFFKQWEGARKKAAGKMLEDRTWSQMPRTRVRAA